MAAFVAFELWVPLLAVALRAIVGSTVPTAIQVLASLLGLAVPTVVGLALSDYLADRPGLVKPYQPRRRPGPERSASEPVDRETSDNAGPDGGSGSDDEDTAGGRGDDA